MKVYGIKNCSTVKKAIDWLQTNNLPFEFHDFKKLGVSGEILESWVEKLGWEKLVNKKGTTWKQLDPARQLSIQTAQDAVKLMQEFTSVIKRPVIETDDQILVGFDEAAYRENFKTA